MPDQERVVRVRSTVPAPPEQVFELLARPAEHARFDGSGTVQGSPDGPERLSLGATFGMGMRQFGVPYRSTSEVVEFEEGSRIAWRSFGEAAGRRFIGGQTWRYRLSPDGTGTEVVHEYEWGTSMTPWMLPLLRYPQRAAGWMTASLDRLAQQL